MATRIEAKAVISGEDKLSRVIDGIDKRLKGVGKGINAAAGFDKLNTSLAKAKGQLEAIDRLNRAQGKMASAKLGLSGALARAEQAASAMATARKAGNASLVADLTAQSKAAQRAVTQATAAVQRQAGAVEAAKRSFAGFGVPVQNMVGHENALRASIDKTTSALQRQTAEFKKQHEIAERALARSMARKEALAGAGAAAGIYAGHKGKEIGLQAIREAAEMDYAVRYQRIVSEVSEAKQQALLLPQAKRIGQETKFSNKDIVEAQTATMQSLPFTDPNMKADVGAAIVDQVRNYAVIMRADMTESAEAIRSFLQSTGKDISTKEKAVHEATRATNLIIASAERGGMSHEDAAQAIKFGAATSKSAGLSDLTVAALGSVARRGGLRGDEIGTFQRAAASKLVAPTSKGLDALTAAGIDYNKFTTMPGGLSTDNLESFAKRRFGKAFSDDQRTRLGEVLSDGDVIADRDEFTKRVSEIVAEGFDKKKDGKTKAQDAQKIAKMVGDFHKLSTESVNSEGLLAEILSNPRMTIALKNAFFTDKHGGKASIIGEQFGQLKEDKDYIKKASEDPTFGSSKSKVMTEGLGGAIDNLKGSYETLVLNIGEANSGLIKFAAEGLAKGNDMFSNMSKTSQQVASLAGGAAAASAALYGTAKFMGAVFGTGGSAIALTGSAAALDASAAALTAAALKLGAAGSVPDMTKKMGEAGRTGGAADAAGKGKLASAAKVVGGATAIGALSGAAQEYNVLSMPDPNDGLGKSILKFLDPGLASRVYGTDEAKDKGEEAGKAAGEGVADGVKEKAPEVIEQGKTIFERLKGVFSGGIKIPISLDTSGLPGGGSGGGVQNASYSTGGGSGGGIGSRSFGSAGRFGGLGGSAGRSGAGGGGPGGGSGNITGPVAGAPTEGERGEVRAYARAAAIARGIDPNVLDRVMKQESGFNRNARNINAREESYGPMQLNMKGGLGAVALRHGINPRDASTWKKQIDFSLDVVKRDGWRQWYGARDTGVSRWQGIGKGPAKAPGPAQAPLDGAAGGLRKPLESLNRTKVSPTGDASGLHAIRDAAHEARLAIRDLHREQSRLGSNGVGGSRRTGKVMTAMRGAFASQGMG